MTKFQEPNFPANFTQSFNTLREFDKNLVSVLGELALNLNAILDGGISVDDNMDISRFSVTSHVTPGAEFSVAHGLGKVPTGYIVYGQAGAGSVYDGTTSNTSTTLYLKSDASNTVFRIVVF